MKNIILIVTLFAAITFTHRVGAQCPTPEPLNKSATLGTWNGAYSLDGEFVKIGLQLKEENGKLYAFFNIPQESKKNLVYSCRICKGQELHLSKIENKAGMEFVGQIKNEKTMTGKVRFWQDDKIISEEVFTLKKISPFTALK